MCALTAPDWDARAREIVTDWLGPQEDGAWGWLPVKGRNLPDEIAALARPAFTAGQSDRDIDAKMVERALAAFYPSGWHTHWTRKETALGRMRDALHAALPPQSDRGDGWRPISEAPKDGTYFLGCVAGFIPLVMHREGKSWTVPYHDGAEHDPTHWMPLPTGPDTKDTTPSSPRKE